MSLVFITFSLLISMSKISFAFSPKMLLLANCSKLDNIIFAGICNNNGECITENQTLARNKNGCPELTNRFQWQRSGPKSQVTFLSIDLGSSLVLLSSIYEHHHLVEAYGLYISPTPLQRHNICFVLVIVLKLKY